MIELELGYFDIYILFFSRLERHSLENLVIHHHALLFGAAVHTRTSARSGAKDYSGKRLGDKRKLTFRLKVQFFLTFRTCKWFTLTWHPSKHFQNWENQRLGPCVLWSDMNATQPTIFYIGKYFLIRYYLVEF